jgi:hypothetical protein
MLQHDDPVLFQNKLRTNRNQSLYFLWNNIEIMAFVTIMRLTVVDVFCFVFFARYGIRALPLMTFCSLFNFNARLPCEIRESVAGRKSVDPRLVAW